MYKFVTDVLNYLIPLSSIRSFCLIKKFNQLSLFRKLFLFLSAFLISYLGVIYFIYHSTFLAFFMASYVFYIFNKVLGINVKNFKIKVSTIILLSIILVMALFNLFSILKLKFELETSITVDSLTEVNLLFLKGMSLGVITLLSYLLLSYQVGNLLNKIIFRYRPDSKDNLEKTAIFVLIGFVTLSLALTIIGFLTTIDLNLILILFLLSLAYPTFLTIKNHNVAISRLRKLLNTTILIKTISSFNLTVIVILFLSIITTIISIIRTTQFGADALRAYLFTIKLVAEKGTVLETTNNIVPPYPTEMLFVPAYIVGQESVTTFVFSSISLLFILFIYFIIRKFQLKFTETILVLFYCFFYPISSWLLIGELKLDLFILFISMGLFYITNNFKTHRESLLVFYVAGFLMFIKLSNFIYVLPLLTISIYKLIKLGQRTNIFKFFMTILFLFFINIIPWLIFYRIELRHYFGSLNNQVVGMGLSIPAHSFIDRKEYFDNFECDLLTFETERFLGKEVFTSIIATLKDTKSVRSGVPLLSLISPGFHLFISLSILILYLFKFKKSQLGKLNPAYLSVIVFSVATFVIIPTRFMWYFLPSLMLINIFTALKLIEYKAISLLYFMNFWFASYFIINVFATYIPPYRDFYYKFYNLDNYLIKRLKDNIWLSDLANKNDDKYLKTYDYSFLNMPYLLKQHDEKFVYIRENEKFKNSNSLERFLIDNEIKYVILQKPLSNLTTHCLDQQNEYFFNTFSANLREENRFGNLIIYRHN
jgi:hypothetical protein